MKKTKRKIAVWLLLLSFIFATVIPSDGVAAKKIRLSSKTLTIKIGKSKVLKLNGSKAKVSWKVISGKKCVALKKQKKNSVKITGRKKGSAKVQAKTGKKKYICKVKVKEQEEKKPATQKPAVTEKPIHTPFVSEKPSTKPSESPARTEKPTSPPPGTEEPTSPPPETEEPTSTPAAEKAPEPGKDFSINYVREKIEISKSFEGVLEYQQEGEAVWNKVEKNEDTEAFSDISLTEALDNGKNMVLRRAANEGKTAASEIVVVEISRPVSTADKYYQIDVRAGYRYGIESGEVGRQYDVYFSMQPIEDFNTLLKENLKTLMRRAVDEEDTFYESSINYKYIYIRLAATEESFASAWIQAEYRSRDNGFNFDDIP
ncbi:MAG: hypothetical protein J1F22_07610 [Lachnospiraceae bacterium]|nr:hypothetical protein [Lachnospiraceae bacterium]